MKTLLAALVPAAMTLTGCLCGAWDGQDDRVLRTANGDAMQLCSNGGYAVMMANGTILEGHAGGDSAGVSGSDGETGARVFTMTTEDDGSWTSLELGGGWNVVTLDKVELDHAHVQCQDLETRAWWPTGGMYLPTETAFSRTVGETTEEILFCNDGTVRTPNETAYYYASAGKLTVTASTSFEAIYTAAGTLVTPAVAGQPAVAWNRIPVAEMSSGLRCSF